MAKLVFLSIRHRPERSTSNWWCLRKSAPMIGLLTAAMINLHLNDRFKPNSKSKVFSPKVGMVLLFAA
jgi:hypothetical protein